MRRIKPPPVIDKAIVRIIAPSGYILERNLGKNINAIKTQGYRIQYGESLFKKWLFYAGNDSDRLEDFQKSFRQPEVKLILAARGGSGCSRLLKQIDYAYIRKHPKIVVGFSDLTALQCALLKKASLCSIYGPVAVSGFYKRRTATVQLLWRMLRDSSFAENIWNYLGGHVRILQKGEAKGPLIGGCLSVFTQLLGTPYMPDLRNAILFLEDINEPTYKIEKYLTHLRHAGVFTQINGLLLGAFKQWRTEAGQTIHRTITPASLFQEYFREMPYPVISHCKFGHIRNPVPLPIGIPFHLHTAQKLFRPIEPVVHD